MHLLQVKDIIERRGASARNCAVLWPGVFGGAPCLNKHDTCFFVQ